MWVKLVYRWSSALYCNNCRGIKWDNALFWFIQWTKIYLMYMLHWFYNLKGCLSYTENKMKIISFDWFVRCDMFSQKFDLHEYIFKIQRKQLFEVFILTKTNICLRIDQFYYNGKKDQKIILKNALHYKPALTTIFRKTLLLFS